MKKLFLIILILVGLNMGYCKKIIAADQYYTDDGISELEDVNSKVKNIIGTDATAEPTPGKFDIDINKLEPIENLWFSDIERVHGEDDRVKVKNYLTNPYKKNVFLVIQFPNGKKYIGSGAMVSNDGVLTAAHNLYSKESGGWAKITVLAGSYENGFKIGQAKSVKSYALKEWITSYSREHDLGFIKLNNNLGEKTGTYSIGISSKIGENVETAGFPGDKERGVQYKVNGKIKNINTNNIFYDMDTYGGQSGSPVFNIKNEIIAVHAYGSNPDNFGTRITQKNLDYINHWIGKPINYKYDKKVSISKNKITVWGNLDLTSKKPLTDIKLGKVFYAKYEYNHPNGYKYLSLYNSENKWMGYFNKRDVIDVIGKPFNKNVIINKDYGVLWEDFYFKKKKGNTKKIVNTEVFAREVYTLGNGRQYYSIYDKKGVWLGYLNKIDTK